MAIPGSVTTERTLYLQSIVDGAPSSEVMGWPLPTKDQFALLGKLIVMYSYIDVFLRWFAELLDQSGSLPAPWKGKTEDLPIADIEKAVRAAPGWTEPNLKALELIEEFRKTRNLAAHFAVKRFPTEDAFLFTTKSARDFRKTLGYDPPPGSLLTAVADVQQIATVIDRCAGLLEWVSKATIELNRQYEALDNRDLC